MERCGYMLRMIGAIALSAFIISFCVADVVEFNNGDRLTGTVVKMVEGKLVFKTATVGEVTIAADQVAGLDTEGPVELHWADGTVLKARIVGAANGRFQLAGIELPEQEPFALADLQAINPPAPEPVRWKGSITAGYSQTSGNSETENAVLAFDLHRRGENDRIKLYGDYIVSESEDPDTETMVVTEESFVTGGKYDYFFSKAFYGFLNTWYKTDHIADLDYRLIGGGGLGYQWVESKTFNFSSDLGYAHVCEKYTIYNAALGREVSTSTDDPSLQMGYHLDWALNSIVSFYHNLNYLATFAGINDYYLSADAEFRAHLNDHLYASLKAILDYDASPAEGAETTDTKYIVGLGLDF